MWPEQQHQLRNLNEHRVQELVQIIRGCPPRAADPWQCWLVQGGAGSGALVAPRDRQPSPLHCVTPPSLRPCCSDGAGAGLGAGAARAGPEQAGLQAQPRGVRCGRWRRQYSWEGSASRSGEVLPPAGQACSKVASSPQLHFENALSRPQLHFESARVCLPHPSHLPDGPPTPPLLRRLRVGAPCRAAAASGACCRSSSSACCARLGGRPSAQLFGQPGLKRGGSGSRSPPRARQWPAALARRTARSVPLWPALGLARLWQSHNSKAPTALFKLGQ